MKEHLIEKCVNSDEYMLLFEEDEAGRDRHRAGKKKKDEAVSLELES